MVNAGVPGMCFVEEGLGMIREEDQVMNPFSRAVPQNFKPRLKSEQKGSTFMNTEIDTNISISALCGIVAFCFPTTV